MHGEWAMTAAQTPVSVLPLVRAAGICAIILVVIAILPH
jgi:hypothetical protein